MVLVNTSGIDAKEAVSALTAAVNTFAREALDTTSIINKLANVDAAFAVSQKDLAEGISRVGAAAADARVPFDQLIATITSVQQTTARGGASIGNSLKTIFTRLERPQVVASLRALNVQLEDTNGESLNAIQVLTNLSKVYNTLSSSQRNNISQQVAGVHQINAFKALITDLGRQYSILGRAQDVSSESTNEATIRNRELTKTLAAQAKIAGTNIQKTLAGAGSIAIAPNAKELLGSFNGVFDKISGSTNSEDSGAKIAEGFLRGIGSALRGPGTITLFAIFVGLFKRVGKFAFDSVKELTGINSKSSEQAAIQSNINNLLQTGNSYYLQRLGQAKTLNEQYRVTEQLILAQNAALARQAAAGSALAGRVGANYAPGANGSLVRRRAEGYIPTANNGLLPALVGEGSAVRRGVGGASKNANVSVIPNFNFGGGKTGPVVANSSEYVVKGYKGGSGSAIFNPDMVKSVGGLSGLSKLGKVQKIAAGGYVPNFAGALLRNANFKGFAPSPGIKKQINNLEHFFLKEAGLTKKQLPQINIQGKNFKGEDADSVGFFDPQSNTLNISANAVKQDVRTQREKSANGNRTGKAPSTRVRGQELERGITETLFHEGFHGIYRGLHATKETRRNAINTLPKEDRINRKEIARKVLAKEAGYAKRDINGVYKSFLIEEALAVKFGRSRVPKAATGMVPNFSDLLINPKLKYIYDDTANYDDKEGPRISQKKREHFRSKGYELVSDEDFNTLAKNKQIQEFIKSGKKLQLFDPSGTLKPASVNGPNRASVRQLLGLDKGGARVLSKLFDVASTSHLPINKLEETTLGKGLSKSVSLEKYLQFNGIGGINPNTIGDVVKLIKRDFPGGAFLKKFGSVQSQGVFSLGQLERGEFNYKDLPKQKEGLIQAAIPNISGREYRVNTAGVAGKARVVGDVLPRMVDGKLNFEAFQNDSRSVGLKDIAYGYKQGGIRGVGQVIEAVLGKEIAKTQARKALNSLPPEFRRGSLGGFDVAETGTRGVLKRGVQLLGEKLGFNAFKGGGVIEFNLGKDYRHADTTTFSGSRYDALLGATEAIQANSAGLSKQFLKRGKDVLALQGPERQSAFDSLYKDLLAFEEIDKRGYLNTVSKLGKVGFGLAAEKAGRLSKLEPGQAGQFFRSKGIKAAGGFIPGFANPLARALATEKLLTGENPKVGLDSRLPDKIGVYSPSQGSLANAINQHLNKEPGRHLGNIGQTGRAAQKGIPHFAPVGLGATNAEIKLRFDELRRAQADNTKELREANREKARERLVSKVDAGESLKPEQSKNLKKLQFESDLREIKVSPEEARFLKRRRPSDYDKVIKPIETRAGVAVDRLENSGRETAQIKKITEFFDKKQGKAGVLFTESSLSKSLAREIKGVLGHAPTGAALKFATDSSSKFITGASANRRQQLFHASFALPLIAQTAQGLVGGDPDSRTSRKANGIIEGIASGGTVAALLPKGGLAIGGLIVGLTSLRAVVNNIAPPLEGFLKGIDQANNILGEQANAINQTIASFDLFQESVNQGNQGAIKRSGQSLINNLNQVSEPNKANLARAIASGDIEQLRQVAADNSSTLGARQKTSQFIGNLTQENDKAGATGNLVRDALLGSRRNLLEAAKKPGDNFLSSTAFRLLTGNQLNEENVRSQFKSLNPDKLDTIKEYVGTIPIKAGELDVKDLEKRRSDKADPNLIIQDILKTSGINDDRLIEALKSSALDDVSKIADNLINKVKESQKDAAFAKQAESVAKKVRTFVKLSEDVLQNVGFKFQIDSLKRAASRDSIATSVQGFVSERDQALSPEAKQRVNFAAAQFQTAGDTRDNVSNLINQKIGELRIPQEQLKVPEVANQIAQSISNIVKSPTNVTSELKNIGNALSQGGASKELVDVFEKGGEGLSREIFLALQRGGIEAGKNILNNKIALSAIKRQEQSNFLGGGDFKSQINPEFAELNESLGGFRNRGRLNSPIFRNGIRDSAAEGNRDRGILSEQSTAILELDKLGILPKSGGQRDGAREILRKSLEANMTNSVNELGRSARGTGLEGLIAGSKSQIADAARTQSENLLPGDNGIGGIVGLLNSKTKEDSDINSQVASQIQAVTDNNLALNDVNTQLDRVANSLEPLNTSLAALQDTIKTRFPEIAAAAEGSARGHIPNFSAYSKELRAIKQGVGGAIHTDQPKFANIKGKGPSFVNTGEDIVRDFMGSGKDAVFNRQMQGELGIPLSNLGKVENVAGGHIPNFAILNTERDRVSNSKKTGASFQSALSNMYGASETTGSKNSSNGFSYSSRILGESGPSKGVSDFVNNQKQSFEDWQRAEQKKRNAAGIAYNIATGYVPNFADNNEVKGGVAGGLAARLGGSKVTQFAKRWGVPLVVAYKALQANSSVYDNLERPENRQLGGFQKAGIYASATLGSGADALKAIDPTEYFGSLGGKDNGVVSKVLKFYSSFSGQENAYKGGSFAQYTSDIATDAFGGTVSTDKPLSPKSSINKPTAPTIKETKESIASKAYIQNIRTDLGKYYSTGKQDKTLFSSIDKRVKDIRGNLDIYSKRTGPNTLGESEALKNYQDFIGGYQREATAGYKGSALQKQTDASSAVNAAARKRGFRDADQLEAFKSGKSLSISSTTTDTGFSSPLPKSVNAESAPLPSWAIGKDRDGYFIGEDGRSYPPGYDPTKEIQGLARGFVPNFANTIISRRARRAIRALGGTAGRSTKKTVGPLTAIKQMIDNGNRKEAKDAIINGGLPQSFLDAGLNENNLAGVSTAIQREYDSLVGRGVPTNLASGYIFIGNRPEIGGIGVGNYLDEPHGRTNHNMGILQGINRVKSQGGNPATSGTPNFAAGGTDFSELINTLKELVAKLDAKQTQGGAEGGGESSSSVKVDHNINVNASINGQISSANSEVDGIIQQTIEQLKARIAALETAQKGNKNFVPRPPQSTPQALV
jgi:TP901 family phage tail tape measure protein